MLTCATPSVADPVRLTVHFSVAGDARDPDFGLARLGRERQIRYGLPPEIATVLASQETVGAITVATLAATNEAVRMIRSSAAGVFAHEAKRAGGDSIRVAPHLHNTPADVERLLTVLREAVAK